MKMLMICILILLKLNQLFQNDDGLNMYIFLYNKLLFYIKFIRFLMFILFFNIKLLIDEMYYNYINVVFYD